MFRHNKLKTDLNSFLAIVITLIVIGLLFIYSSSSIYALEKHQCSYYFFKKQMIGALIGISTLFLFHFISPLFIASVTPFFFWTSLTLTAGTLISPLAVRINGSSRWIKLLFFTFQPSELLKVAFVLYCAYFLSSKVSTHFSFKKTYLPFFCIIGAVSLILLRQPDFGLSVTLAATSMGLLFIAGLPLTHLFITIGATVPLLIFLIFKNSYRMRRILTFLNPWSDPQGAGFQIIQSLIAIGSGSWLGTGIAHSKQKFFYLPMQHTDFIFAIIAEETGFVGSCILLILFSLFAYFGFKLAWQCKKLFHVYTILGFTILLTLQALINIFVVIGLVPTKGIGLPFISYGNSALLSSCIMVGVIVSIVQHEQSNQSYLS